MPAVSAEPAFTAEQRAARWPAKRDGTCNICKNKFPEGARIGIDPAKPWWFNTHSKQWVNNYAHAGCLDANEQNATVGQTIAQRGLHAAEAVAQEQRAEVSAIVDEFRQGLGLQMSAFRKLAAFLEAQD